MLRIRFGLAVLATSALSIGFINGGWSAPMPADLPKADASWEELSNDEGILVHRKEVEGSDVVAFRGETVIEAPIAKVANILIDTSRKLEWVARCVEAKNVRQLSTYERIEYNKTHTPWPLQNRDFLFRATAEFDTTKKRAVFRMKSVEDALAPETDDAVRAHLHNSAYSLTSLGDGKKTHVVVEIHADPKGAVPKWVVNLFQKSWPQKTLGGIRGQVAKPDVKDHPGIRDLFAEPASVTTPAS